MATRMLVDLPVAADKQVRLATVACFVLYERVRANDARSLLSAPDAVIVH